MKDVSDCTILVVDDTEVNIDLMVAILGEDYDVSVALDGRPRWSSPRQFARISCCWIL